MRGRAEVGFGRQLAGLGGFLDRSALAGGRLVGFRRLRGLGGLLGLRLGWRLAFLRGAEAKTFLAKN